MQHLSPSDLLDPEKMKEIDAQFKPLSPEDVAKIKKQADSFNKKKVIEFADK